MIRFGVFVPCYGGRIASPVVNSILRDYDYCNGAGHSFAYFSHDIQPVDRARNLAVDRARTMGLEYLMSYDADTFVDPRGSALEALHKSLIEWNETNEERAVAISAVTVCRGGDLLNARPAKPDEVYPAEKVGAAVMLIDLHGLDQLAKEHVWFRYQLAGNGIDTLAGEDVYFCQEVNRLGGVVLANYQVPTRHLSEVPLRLERFHVTESEPA